MVAINDQLGFTNGSVHLSFELKLAGKWTHGFDTSPQERWLAAGDGGTPVGGYLLRLDDKENTSLADCVLIVSPASRRAGVGRALAAHCARHDATGEFVALTEIAIDAGMPDSPFQMITVVVPEHRGHRLGLLVKVANLELLQKAEPQVRRISTGNANSNEHMIAINLQLGYQPTDVYRHWELELTGSPATAQS